MDIRAKGARCDGKRITDSAIASGTAILTSATAAFNLADVGKTILVEAAGASGGTLLTTIQSLTNGTTVVLAANAGTTVSGARAEYGTDDKSAIDAALTAAKIAGGNATLPGAAITFSSGGHAGLPGCELVGAGQANTYVRHTGNNVFFKYTEGGVSPNGVNAGGARDFTLRGNPGASAVGIQVSDAFGAKMRRILVGGRPISATGRGDFDTYNGGGVAWLLQNETYWTEGTVLDECGSMFNDVGWRLQNHLNADPTKNNSFAYTKAKDFFMQVPTNGTGWDLGGTDDNPILLYNADISMHVWGSQSATQINNTCIDVRKNAQLPPLSNVRVRGEVIGGTGNIWIRNRGDGTNGGRFNPSGFVNVYRDAGCTDDLQAGSQTTQHRAAVGLARTKTSVTPSLIAAQDSGTGAWKLVHAGVAMSADSNEETVVLWGFKSSGKPVVKIAPRTGTGTDDPGAPWDADTATSFWFDDSGFPCIGSTSDPRKIRRGSADPEGSVTASRGEQYIRTLNTGKSLYVKSQGDATNTGWVCISALKGSATWDPPSIATLAVGAAKTVTVVGAAVGDFALASFSIPLPAGYFLTAEVTAVDTVSVTPVNMSASTQDVVSGTVSVRVEKN